MSYSDRAQTPGDGWQRHLRRPVDFANGTRWLFGVLALATLVVQVPFSVAFDGGWVPVMGICGAAVLATSWIISYLRGRVPWWLDLVEATAMLGFALSGRLPETVFAILLSALWFRALYGSAWRSAWRCALYTAVVVLTFELWTKIPGHGALADSGKNPGGLAVVVLTVVVGRQLGRGLAAREQSLRVNEGLAAAGSRLIGMTDETAIRALAWDAAVQVSSASPGVRMIVIRRTELGLHVEAAAGSFDLGAPDLPGGLLYTGASKTILTDPGPLDLAAGTTLAWLVFELPHQDDAWLLVGAHKAVPPDVVVAVRSLINQVMLALANSDVHQELIVQARVDSLTGLANRVTFNAELSAELAALHDGVTLHVLFLDLDDFKNVNDLLGHRYGDVLLQEWGSGCANAHVPTTCAPALAATNSQSSCDTPPRQWPSRLLNARWTPSPGRCGWGNTTPASAQASASPPPPRAPTWKPWSTTPTSPCTRPKRVAKAELSCFTSTC